MPKFRVIKHNQSFPTSQSRLSPRFSRLGVAGILCAAVGVLCIHIDTPLAALADGTHLRGDARRVLDLAEAFSFGPSALMIALGVVVADSRNKWFTARLFAYPILAGVLANVVKIVMPRLRPRGLPELAALLPEAPSGWDTFFYVNPVASVAELGQGSASAWQAFPSAHTATAIGLAIGLTRLYPHARWYFAALALFAGLQRIISNAHYPSDVLVGAGVAMLSCWLFEQKSAWSLAIREGAGTVAAPSILKQAA